MLGCLRGFSDSGSINTLCSKQGCSNTLMLLTVEVVLVISLYLAPQLWFSDTWAPDEHFIPTLVRITVDKQLHVLQVGTYSFVSISFLFAFMLFKTLTQ